MVTMYSLRSVIGICLCLLSMNIVECVNLRQEIQESPFTPIPFMDINKDLRPLLFGSEKDYFISNYAADATTARRVCGNLTDLTGKHFHLLVLEAASEFNELTSYLNALNISGIWTAGEKSYNDNGDIATAWVTDKGTVLMSYKNFRQGLSSRGIKRSIESYSEGEEPTNGTTAVLYPWINLSKSENGGKCRNGKYTPPECEPVQCNVTMPECETYTPPCTIKDQSDCTVIRPDCTAKCENCTVIPPVCHAQPKPCTVTVEPCQAIQTPCNVTTPDCITTRPPCKTIQPPCDITTPPPCTTTRPLCIPSFRKDNCTTTTFPCKTNNKNETVCPAPRTVCEPSYKCPPPEICQTPAIICPPPLIYCEPETTICPEPIITCKNPAIFCLPPQVDCPKPEITCSQPQVICSPPVVNCPGIVTSCRQPQLECPPPSVNCPSPIVTCTKPQPCEPPSPPPCLTDPTTTTTTPKPCNGCGCILLSKQHDFKWDIETCRNEHHFICEG